MLLAVVMPDVSFLGAFNLAGSVRSFFLPLGFVALYVAWVCFAWFYFLLEPFFLMPDTICVYIAVFLSHLLGPRNKGGGKTALS